MLLDFFSWVVILISSIVLIIDILYIEALKDKLFTIGKIPNDKKKQV